MNAPTLSWPAEKFRSVFSAALVAAASDSDRPHLSAVFVRRQNRVVTVDATDGTWCLRWREVEGQTDDDGNPLDRLPFSCLIPRRVIESFLAATKKPLDLERCVLTVDESPYRLATIFDVCIHEFRPIPNEFPPLEKIIPTVLSPTVTSIGVGAGMMSRVAKAFALATGAPEATVFWQFSGDALSPLVCTTPESEELVAVVMPHRVEPKPDANALPEKPAS